MQSDTYFELETNICSAHGRSKFFWHPALQSIHSTSKTSKKWYSSPRYEHLLSTLSLYCVARTRFSAAPVPYYLSLNTVIIVLERMKDQESQGLQFVLGFNCLSTKNYPFHSHKIQISTTSNIINQLDNNYELYCSKPHHIIQATKSPWLQQRSSWLRNSLISRKNPDCKSKSSAECLPQGVPQWKHQ